MPLNRRTFLHLPYLAIAPRPLRAQEIMPLGRDYWPTTGWQTDDPANHKVDAAKLAVVDEIIEAGMPDITGLIVVRGGYIVYERYFGGQYGRSDPVRVWSITKSVTGSLIGIALANGDLTDLDQSIGDLIPDHLPAGIDPRTPGITIRQLLTMTPGWEWDIKTDYQRLTASDNWLAYTLSRPVVHAPGSSFAYNSGASHVLSVIVAAVTGRDTADYAQDNLFTPLGIARPEWERSPQGETAGGFGLALSPRNLAKLGFLLLNHGRWEETVILPRAYAEQATSYQADGDEIGMAAYGFHWWVTRDQTPAAYFALGFANQYLYVVPERDLVIVVAKGFTHDPPLITAARPLIERFILPAVAEQHPVG